MDGETAVMAIGNVWRYQANALSKCRQREHKCIVCSEPGSFLKQLGKHSEDDADDGDGARPMPHFKLDWHAYQTRVCKDRKPTPKPDV